jgi:hypothetical protein
MNCNDAARNGRRNILALAHTPKTQPDIGFFRNIGVALIAFTMLAGSIAVGMTLIQF